MQNPLAADFGVEILARVLSNGGELPVNIAQYLLGLGFNARDKKRMRELVVRNQEGALSEEEREELFAFARTGTVISILKAKARRVVKKKMKKHTLS